MKTTYIYELSRNGVPFYIGKSTDPYMRKYHHRRSWKDALLTVIDEVTGDKHKWKPLESYWIEQYKQWGYSLINRNNGGGGMLSKYDDESLKRVKREWHKRARDKVKDKQSSYFKEYYQQRKNDKEWVQRRAEYKKQYYQQKRGSLDT